MDLWNRLIGGSGSSNSSNAQKPPPPATPQQRLAKFKRMWQTLLHSWRNARENDPTSQDMLRSHIKRILDLLAEEERRSERLCMNFCYEQQVFIAISKIGQSGSIGVIRECIAAFSMLIDNEDEEFLGQENFAQSLIAFLRATSQRSTPAIESEFVELLFSIAAKIRLSPGILQAWFINSAEETGRNFDELDQRQKFAGVTNKEDFPLFYLLIDYVHHEGRVGDFARTGLLYIIEAASSSINLEQWIVESDLATLMASGLGALYSQLSRKLIITYPKEDPPTILMLSDHQPNPPAFGAERSDSPEFQTHLETFLSYLIFWQDVMEHCRSMEVKQTLLDHFQVLFLQQLLYPSLLESSDIDGGSSVAVLTYVRAILDTLDHPDIIHLILSYLMAIKEKPQPQQPSSPSLARRRKSLDLLSQTANVVDNPTPDLFNLGDLIMTSLCSKSQQTVSATLRLVSTILRKHYPYSLSTLIRTVPVPSNAPARTIGAHNKEMELFFSFVTEISGDNNAAQSYDDHLKDCLILLESHPCSVNLLGLKDTTSSRARNGRIDPGQEKLKNMNMHTLQQSDPLLKNLVELLSTFFSNTVETNLVLTCVIVDLATCGWMRPEGWLLFDPEAYEYDSPEDSDEEERDELEEMEDELVEIMGDTTAVDNEEEILAEKERRRVRELKKARRQPNMTKTPPIMETLQSLVEQIQTYRREVPDLDDKLAERRHAFEFTDELNEALASSPLTSTGGTSQQQQQQPSSFMKNPMLESISARNLARPSTTPSRPRQQTPAGFSTPTRTSRGTGRNVMNSVTPVRGISPAPNSASSSPFGNHVATTTQRKIKVLQPGQKTLHLPPPPEGESREGSIRGDTPTPTPPRDGEAGDREVVEKEFTLSHLLTNIMILQEFILELAALTQVRASLFGDVKFS